LKLLANDFIPPIPAVRHHYMDIVNHEGKPDRLLVITVEPSKSVHSLRSGQTYIRRNNQTNLVNHEQSLRLQYEKGSITFESEMVKNVAIEALDQKLLQEFLNYNKSDGKNIERFLLNNGLAEETEGKILLNNAAVLIFSPNPSIALKRKCGITIVHYFGLRPVPSGKPNFRRHPFTIEGPLMEQIRQAFQYVSDNAIPTKLEGPTFKRLRIPAFVIQEAITNAVLHRDYSIQDNIQIRIFDDRIEIVSPGWFAGSVTPETIRDDRFARNPILERTLKKMPDPPNLDIGEGVDRMFYEMDKRNLYRPLYLPRKYTPHAVCVVLFNEERVSYWDVVEKYLSGHDRITNKEFCGLTGLDTLSASELFRKWTQKQLLEKAGTSKKSTYYRKPAAGKGQSAGLLGEGF
jgi:ATP-dependent DNA helicase RecG